MTHDEAMKLVQEFSSTSNVDAYGYARVFASYIRSLPESAARTPNTFEVCNRCCLPERYWASCDGKACPLRPAQETKK